MAYTLTQIQTAIEQILTTGQSWMIGDTRRTAADLDKLYALEERLNLQSSGTAAQMFTVAQFKNAQAQSQ